MGTIYRNGVPFVGSGGAGGVEMTQAEYDLLPTSEKMNGAIYFITDGDVSYPSASQMRYDNTESQIPSTTVQGAIDENRIEINDLKAVLTGFIKVKKTASSKTISAYSTTSFDIDCTESGYSPVSIAGFDVRDGNANLVNIGFTSLTSIRMWIKNTSSSALTIEPTADILYFPTI